MSITIANPTAPPSLQPGGPAPQRPSVPASVAAASNQASGVAPTRVAESTTTPPPPTAESAKALRDALSEATQVLQKTAQGLEFTLDKDLGRTVVKVIDSQTREVLRQIPDTEVLHMAKAIDKMRGLLVRMVA